MMMSFSSLMEIFLYSDENTRVCLSPIRGIDGSDYINASYIDVNCFLKETTEIFISNMRFFVSPRVID